MFYTMTVAVTLLHAANGAQGDGDLLARKRPHNPANAASPMTDLVHELMATHGATPAVEVDGELDVDGGPAEPSPPATAKYADPGGTWDPYKTQSGQGSFLQDAGAPTQDKFGVDYDLVADPAALVHIQPKDAVVADVDGASPAPKDRKILARSISYRARVHRRRRQRRGQKPPRAVSGTDDRRRERVL